MLEIVSCRGYIHKRQLFAELTPQKQTWVVSDLQSKWHLQKELLNRHHAIEKSSVLRALELWEELGFQVFPQTHLLSNELAQTLFWNWLEPMHLPWAKSPKAVAVIINQMKMWMSICSDPKYPQIMREWFKVNSESYVRWGHWFELCSTIWEKCRQQNIIMKEWLPALLLNQDLSSLRWKKELIFDLGSQISQVEGQLISELSKFLSIKIIYPESPWINLIPNTLRPYQHLVGGIAKGEGDWVPLPRDTVSFGRFSTQLAEVKDTVAQVRIWLEQGVNLQSIAIVAPDIEEYWPCLKLYLDEEGIPVSKSMNAHLISFIEINHWLACLRTSLHKVSSEDLEIFLFSGRQRAQIDFDQFKVLFTNLYDAQDLSRAERLFKSLETLKSDQLISVFDFIGWSLKFWTKDATSERLQLVLQKMSKEVPEDLKLLPNQWLSYLEGLLKRREINVEPGNEDGLSCVSLSSSEWLPVTHAVFLNLSEQALRTVDISPVSASEADRVFSDTGYALASHDRGEREFEFLSFFSRDWINLKLNFSATDFTGKVLTPSRLWMWSGFLANKLKEKPEAPQTTKWDDLQRLQPEYLLKAREVDLDRRKNISEGLARDIGQPINSWSELKEFRVSASSLESFWKCPFIFAATRKLKLSDEPALDLDMDYRTRGRLLHSVLEVLSVEPLKDSYSDAELEQIIEDVRSSNRIQVGDERLWAAQRAQHVDLAKKFLRFEREWRKLFPETYTSGREVGFECHWSLEEGVAKSGAGEVLLTGRIDRVDRDSSGHYAVIDYKASQNGLTNWKSWLGNHEIQMILYAMLVETGLTPLAVGEVVAANYYVVKDSDRRKGFYVDDVASGLYSTDLKYRSAISKEEKLRIFTEMSTLISEAISLIQLGQLNPAPLDLTTCDKCSWRGLCRAPHLN